MKILTIKEPFASLIANGIKKYEFRSWKTNYRGELFIHTSKIPDKSIKDFNFEYRYNEIICKVNLVDIIKLDEEIGNKIYQENPKVYGKHNDGYAWIIENPTIIQDHTKIKGRLGLWEK